MDIPLLLCAISPPWEKSLLLNFIFSVFIRQKSSSQLLFPFWEWDGGNGMRTAAMSHTCSGLVVFMSTKSLDASRVRSSSNVWCCPWPGTSVKYGKVAKSDSDQMKASRLCGSPLSVILNVMLHHYTLKRGLSFSDSSLSFATGYCTQTSKTQSFLSSLNRTAIK